MVNKPLCGQAEGGLGSAGGEVFEQELSFSAVGRPSLVKANTLPPTPPPVMEGSLGSRPQFAPNYSVIVIKLLYFSESQFLVCNMLIISTFSSRALLGYIWNVTFTVEVIFGHLLLGVL